MESVKARVVIITGASSGIGAAAAEEFARYGAYLSLTGRNEDRLREVAARCQQRGVSPQKILLIPCDLANDDSLDKIISETVQKFGEIHVLVNNAGIMEASDLEHLTPDSMDRLYRVNLRAPMFLSQKALPHLKKTKGNIVNISSVGGAVPATTEFGYGITKAGLDHFTRTLAVELGPLGIRVNGISPGEIRTNIQNTADYVKGEVQDYMELSASWHPLGRVGAPSEVASTIVFLASDAASFVTGATVNVDGGIGQTAAWSPGELTAIRDKLKQGH